MSENVSPLGEEYSSALSSLAASTPASMSPACDIRYPAVSRRRAAASRSSRVAAMGCSAGVLSI